MKQRMVNKVCVLLLLSLLLPPIASWEIINDDYEPEESDDFLEAEELIPVDSVAKNTAKGSKRSLNAVSTASKVKAETAQPKVPGSSSQSSPKSITKASVSTKVPSNQGAGTTAKHEAEPTVGKKEPVSADVVDMRVEGFIPIEEKVKSPTRKLAQAEDAAAENASDAPSENLAVKPVMKLRVISGPSVKDDKKVKKTSVGERSKDADSEAHHDILDIACIDKNSWECLMFKEDYIAMKKDWNLSDQALAKLRVKRQIDNAATVAPTTDTTTIIPEFGSGENLYNDQVTLTPNLIIDQTTTFTKKNATQSIDSTRKQQIKKQLEDQLNELLKNVTGFLNAIVTDIIVNNQTGEVEILWQVSVNGSDAGFLSGNISTIVDKIFGDLLKVNGSFLGINVDGLELMEGLNLDDIKKQIESTLNDPCSLSPCSAGYGGCKAENLDNHSPLQVVCFHNCVLMNMNTSCNQGVCELDINFEPVCICHTNWEGASCDTKMSKALDAGQITGVTLGAIAVTAGLLGCCFWFLACRKSDRDIAFTHYSDEEGSSRFSNPSSLLSGFVIDRPQISANPIPVFSPANAGSLGPTDDAGIPPETNTTYPYSTA